MANTGPQIQRYTFYSESVLANNGNYHLLTNSGSSIVEALCSDQEEADTRIALHVCHIIDGQPGPIIIRSPSGNTNIPVIHLALFTDCQCLLSLDNGQFDLHSCEMVIHRKKCLLLSYR